jgi:bacteriochlorophyllide a dehydrogenase
MLRRKNPRYENPPTLREKDYQVISIFSRRRTSGGDNVPAVNGSDTKAIVFAGPHKAVLTEIRSAEAGEWDLTVQTLISGVSIGTERWALSGRRPEVQFPIVPGYLALGRVTGIGERTTGFQTGDRVVTFAGRQPVGFPPNWMCAHLAKQIITLNPDEYLRDADLPYCLKVPESVADEEGVFAGLAAVSKQGLDMIQVPQGATAAVFGLGLIGQFSAQLLRLAGADVSVLDLHPGRTLAACKLGASRAFQAGTQNADQQIRAFAPNGFDIVIDTTGSAHAVNSAVRHMRVGGQFVFQGWYPAGQPPIDLNAFHERSARVFFPCGLRGRDVGLCLDLLAEKKLQVSPLITHRFRPEEAPAAYRSILENDPAALGIVFNWS